MKKAIFLDRDWTINKVSIYRKFTNKVEDVELTRNALEWLLLLKSMWFLLVIISNQTWIWVWLYTQEEMDQVNAEIQRQLWIEFDWIYVCTLAPTPDNPCRKPSPSMVFEAAKDLNIDISKSYFVWDKTKDIQTWENSGCLWTCLIHSHYELEKNVKPDFIVDDLLEFAKSIWKIDNKS